MTQTISLLADGSTIAHVTGTLRTQAATFIAEHHYMRSAGGSGYTIAAMAPDRSIMGVVLIGPASSMAAERAIINPPYRVWCIKRLVCLDDASVPESQLLRTAMRYIANLRQEVMPFVAYADPAARDERTGQPLFGGLYKSANFMHIGTTSQRRYSVVDDKRRAISTRQGVITLTRKTLPLGWQMIPLPSAHVWLAIVTPDNQLAKRYYLPVNGGANAPGALRGVHYIHIGAWPRNNGSTMWHGVVS